MNKTYLHLMPMSTSKSMPVTTIAPSNDTHGHSHSTELDSLLDELEVEYGLKTTDSKMNLADGKSKMKIERHKAFENYHTEDDEIDQNEWKVWEMAKSIKKHNVSYRTVAILLRDLQKDQRNIQSKGLLPASVTVSTTSCSSLENGSHQNQVTKKCQSPKSPYCNNNKRVTFNQNANKSSVSAIMLQPKPEQPQLQQQPQLKKTAVVVDKPISIIPPQLQERFATPTLASSAKAKSKSNLTMSYPMNNSETPSGDQNIKRKSISSDLNIATQSLKQEFKSSRIPTPSRHKLDSPLTKVSATKAGSLPKIPTEKPKEIESLSTIRKHSQKKIEKFVPGIIQPLPIEPEPSGNNALTIIRDLLEHAKSAAMTLFDFDDDYYDQYEDDDDDTASDATVIIDTKNRIPQLSQVKLKENNHKETMTPKMEMLFGVPYIPGVSKIPKPNYFV